MTTPPSSLLQVRQSIQHHSLNEGRSALEAFLIVVLLVFLLLGDDVVNEIDESAVVGGLQGAAVDGAVGVAACSVINA